MAVAHENGVLPDSGPPRLGEILVERGLLSEEQLAYALGEGQRTGEPIGEVIVRLGFAVPATIAQALATQHGGPMKSEYGYAVGFAPPNATPAVPVAPPPLAPGPAVTSPAEPPGLALRTVPITPVVDPVQHSAEPVVQTVEAVAQHVEIPVQPVEAVPQDAIAPGPDPEMARLQAQVEELAGALDAARRETRAVAAERSTLAVELESARSRNVELEPAAAEAAAARAELERVALESAARIAELEQRLGELDGAAARTIELEASLEAACEQAARNENETAALDAARGTIAVQNAELARRIAELEAAAEHESAARAADVERMNEEASRRSAEAEQRIAEADRRIAELEAERVELLQTSRASENQTEDSETAAYADSTFHLLFVADHTGYQLIERDGPPPAPGTTFELSADNGIPSTYVVSRVGSAPLPGARSACAYVSPV
jgi:hypothetical protein